LHSLKREKKKQGPACRAGQRRGNNRKKKRKGQGGFSDQEMRVNPGVGKRGGPRRNTGNGKTARKGTGGAVVCGRAPTYACTVRLKDVGPDCLRVLGKKKDRGGESFTGFEASSRQRGEGR